MPSILTSKAVEGSTYILSVAFTDENGDAVTPDSIVYTLTTENGYIVNSLEDEPVTPDTSVDIVLSGDDLQILDGEKKTVITIDGEKFNQVNRHCTIEWVYDSDAGQDLPGKDVAIFPLIDLTAIT